MQELVFTPAAVLGLLTQIEELEGLDVGIVEAPNGNIQIMVGDTMYEFPDEKQSEIEVDAAAVDAIAEVNLETYDELSDMDPDLTISHDGEEVEAGILKELVKTLAVGGMVRLSAKLLKG